MLGVVAKETQQSTGIVYGIRRTSGHCGENTMGESKITTATACAVAAATGGWSDVTVDTVSKSKYPSGCYFRSAGKDNTLYFNKFENSKAACSSKRKCLCKQLCQPGTYQDESEQSSCKMCTIGTYSTLGGASCQYSATSCPIGTYATGTASCKSCDIGKYNGQTNKTSCKTCQAGEYQSEVGHASCNNDCSGLRVVTSDATRCIDNRVYKIRTKGTCGDSDSGSGNAAGETKITSHAMCEVAAVAVSWSDKTADSRSSFKYPSGCYYDMFGINELRYNIQNSSKSCSSKKKCLCVQICLEGTYQDQEKQVKCKICPEGTYQDERQSTNCKRCSNGTFSNTGASNCPYTADSCPVGKYASGTTTVCDSCSAGKYNAQTGQQSVASCMACITDAKCGNGTCTDFEGEKVFDIQTGCTTCIKGRRGFSNNCPRCPSAAMSLFVDVFISIVGLYVLFAGLYLMYYDSNENITLSRRTNNYYTPIHKKKWGRALTKIQDQKQVREEAQRIQQAAHVASIVHQNETIKRKYKADLRLQRRRASKNPTSVMPVLKRPQYIPLPTYNHTSSSGRTTATKSKLMTLLEKFNNSEQAKAIQEEGDRSRRQSMDKTKEKKRLAETKLQRRLALRQRAKQERALKKCKLFQDLSDASLDRIVDAMLFEKFTEGSALCEQGSVADKMYLLMKGCCSVHSNQLHVANLYELDIFGEGVVINSNSEPPTLRSATVLAVEDVDVLVLSGKDLSVLIQENILDTKTIQELQRLVVERTHQNEALKEVKRRDILQKCPLFTSLTEKQRNAIADVMQLKHFQKEEILCKQGDVADAMYLIMSGDCEVLVGKKKASTLKKFDIFGEGALFGNVRNATVRVNSEQAEVLMLPREDLEILAQSNTLDKQCMKDLEKMSTTRANKNKSMKKMNWRDHVRLQNLYDEIVIIGSDEEDEGVKSKDGNKKDEIVATNETAAKVMAGGEEKKSDGSNVGNIGSVGSVGSDGDIVNVGKEQPQPNNQPTSKKSSLRAGQGNHDDVADMTDFSKKIIQKKTIQKLGTSMRRILVNQMMILSAILPSIRWNSYFPRSLVQFIVGVATFFTVDFSAVFTSPECTAKTTARGQWVIRVLIPFMLAFCLLVWGGFAKWWLKKRPHVQRMTLVRISRIAVRLLLLGLYKTAVETSLQILNCEKTVDGKTLWKDSLPCPFDFTIRTAAVTRSNDVYLAVIGICMLVLYGLLPYLYITVQLCRHGRPKESEGYTLTFNYVSYGWATEGYKPHAYVWEPFNALMIVLAVAAEELLLEENKQIMQAIIVGASILLHALIRPYEDAAGNVVVVLFGVCELFGILGADEHKVLQWIHIVLLLVAVLILIYFTLTAMYETVRTKREQIRSGMRSDAQYAVSKIEGRLLMPLMLVIVLCLSPLFAIAYSLRTMTWMLYLINQRARAQTSDKNKISKIEGGQAIKGRCCCLIYTINFFARLTIKFLEPLAIILSMINQGVLHSVAARVGLHSYLIDREKLGWIHIAEMNDIIQLGVNVKDEHPELRGTRLNVHNDIDGTKLKQLKYTRFRYTLPTLARSGDDIKFHFTHAPKQANELTIHVLKHGDISMTFRECIGEAVPWIVRTQKTSEGTCIDFEVPETMISMLHKALGGQVTAWANSNGTLGSREAWCNETIQEAGTDTWENMCMKDRWIFSAGDWRFHQSLAMELKQHRSRGSTLVVTDPWGHPYTYNIAVQKKQGDTMAFRFAPEGRVWVNGVLQQEMRRRARSIRRHISNIQH